MNGYERIDHALKRQKTDQIPVMLHNFMPAATESGISMAEYRSDAKKMADAHIHAARKYGLDGILLDVDTCLEAGAIGVPVALLENEPAVVLGSASDNIDELIAMMEPDRLLKYDRIKVYLDAIHIMKKRVDGELWIRGNCDQMAYSLAMLAYGMQDFMAALLDEEQEEKIVELIDRAYYVHLSFHQLVMEAGADMTSFGDSSCGPELISPALYMKYANPYHKRLRKDLKRLNIQTVCHICGNLDLIMEEVAKVGFTGVEIDYKTNIELAARIFKERSIVFGPLDPTGMFYRGQPEEIENEVKKVLDCFEGNGIIIGAGCALSPFTPEANIRTFLKAVKSYQK